MLQNKIKNLIKKMKKKYLLKVGIFKHKASRDKNTDILQPKNCTLEGLKNRKCLDTLSYIHRL